MRVNLLFVELLCAGSIAALPQALTPTPYPSPTYGIPEPPETEVPTSSASAPEPTETEDTDVCSLNFDSSEDAKDTWDNSGAGDFLSDYLSEHGVEGWANDIFRDTVAGGSQGGSTFDCETIPNGDCSLPQNDECGTYDHSEMFFIQIAIANLYSALETIYMELDGEALIALGKTASEVEGLYGNSDDSIFPFLIGAFVSAAAAMGPVWQFAAPLTAVVGVLNFAAAMEANSQEDIGDGLESAVVDFYSSVRGSLKVAVSAVLAGDFEEIENLEGDEMDFILDTFSDGKVLVTDDTNDAVDEYLETFRTLMTHMLIFKCLSDSGWELLMFEGEEENCAAQSLDTGLWMDTGDGERCVTIAKFESNSNDWFGGGMSSNLNDDQFSALTDDYGVDLEEAFKSILDCDGGEFEYEYTGVPDLEEDAGFYPSCILPMRVTTN